MKTLRLSFIVTIVIVAFLCSGLVAALNSDEATVQTFFSSDTLQAGQTATLNIFFTSTSADELQILNVGIHFDWMPSGTFLGFNLNSSNIIIPSGGGTQNFGPITVQVPLTVASGSHTYYVGIDGTQGTSSTPFSWDSPTATRDVIGGTGNTTPTSTNSGGGQPAGQLNFLLYGAIVAVVVIVAVLIIVFVMRKKRTKPSSATNQGAGQPETPSPEKKPNPEQDFNI